MKTSIIAIVFAFSGCAQPMYTNAFPAEGAALSAEERPELIINGGFELPAFGQAGWSVFQSIEGWTTTFGPGIEVQNNVAGSPHQGSQHVELDSHSSSGMYQDVSTEPGHSYRLSFAFSARPDTKLQDNLLLVVWNGQVIDEVSPEQYGWGTYEYTFTATTKMSRLEFRDASQSNSLGTYIDSVSLREASQVACR